MRSPTETEVSILHDHKETDRKEYVFLILEDADTENVQEHLADLTKHIQRLSMGEDESAQKRLFQAHMLFEPLPHVSRQASLLGGLSVTEVAQLFDEFGGKPLSRAGVERFL